MTETNADIGRSVFDIMDKLKAERDEALSDFAVLEKAAVLAADALRKELEKAKAGDDYCAKSWEREIVANNALRARLRKMAEALLPFSNVAYLVEHHAWALECLDLQPAHFHDAVAAVRGE